MRDDRPTSNASYEIRPADKEIKLCNATGRQGMQATGRDQPTGRPSYWMSSAGQRQELRPYLCQPVSRQFNVRGPRMQALTSADCRVNVVPDDEDPAPRRRPRTVLPYLLARIMAHLGIGIDPPCLAGTSTGATPRGHRPNSNPGY